MTNDEAIDLLKYMKVFIGYDSENPLVKGMQIALDMAIQLLNQEPCKDCINREETLKILCDKCPMYDCITRCESYRAIEKMTSV